MNVLGSLSLRRFVLSAVRGDNVCHAVCQHRTLLAEVAGLHSRRHNLINCLFSACDVEWFQCLCLEVTVRAVAGLWPNAKTVCSVYFCRLQETVGENRYVTAPAQAEWRQTGYPGWGNFYIKASIINGVRVSQTGMDSYSWGGGCTSHWQLLKNNEPKAQGCYPV